jgi:hypothetical protein
MRSQVLSILLLSGHGAYFHLHKQRITWGHVLKLNGTEGRNLKFRAERVLSDMQSRRRVRYREADAAETLQVCIREMLGSNLDRDIVIVIVVFTIFLSLFPIPGSFLIRSNSLFTNHPNIRRQRTW